MADNPIFSYTKRDYERARKEGLARIPMLSNGSWTDLNASDPGVIILDYVHALVDMISYYQDHQALESFISTAKERANIFRLAKQLSYKIRSAKGATCDVEFTSYLVYDYTILIPKYTSVATSTGIEYLTKEDAYLIAGEHRITIPCTQGKLVSSTYQGTGISRFSNIEGATNQSLRIVDNNIDTESVVVRDNLGREWGVVEHLAFADSSARVYQVDLNPDNTITIKFGDGIRGIVPTKEDTLIIEYISTKADEGRVSANTIKILNSEILHDGKYIDFTVDNIHPSSGGYAVQSSQEIREIAPGNIKAQDRAVTLSDFEALAKSVEGVSEAKAYDINLKPDLCLYHEVKVLITPEDSTSSLDVLRKKVYDYLYRRMIPPTSLQVITPTEYKVNIEVNLRKLDSISEGSVKYRVQQSIIDYFNSKAGKLEEYYDPEDLRSIISKLEGVRSISSISPTSKVTSNDLSVISLGDLIITVV